MRWILRHQDDVVLFLHIPKTAGLSLISLIDQQYETEEILPLHSAPTAQSFEIFAPAQLERYRLARGHFRFGPYDQRIYKFLVQNPLLITMLRDPVARVISNYHYIRSRTVPSVEPRRISTQELPINLAREQWEEKRRQLYDAVSEVSLQEFVTNPRFFGQTQNSQTRFILGAIPGVPKFEGDPNALPEEALVFMAKQKLEQFAYVGLVERFAESLELLRRTFGWSFPDELPRLNPTKKPVTPIPQSVIDLILERNRMDLELYEFAQQLFEVRWQSLQRVLAE